MRRSELNRIKLRVWLTQKQSNFWRLRSEDSKLKLKIRTQKLKELLNCFSSREKKSVDFS